MSVPDRVPPAGAESSSQGRTIPYWELLFRETIAIEVLAVVLVWIALRWNAPLEQLADPTHTPNPAKAPWYFTGLQELLHYFPPFVAGIILPGLIVLALVVIPFFNVNIKGVFLCAKYAAHPTGDLGEVVVPEWLATPIWAEAELGVVIGSPVYNASQDAARQAIFGFTIVNDATAPALFDKNNFFLAKSVETFLSLGPSIETDLSEDDVMRGLETVEPFRGLIAR